MYKIDITLNAQEELEAAEAHYSQISEKVSEKFIDTVFKTYFILEINPHFRVWYKNNHAIALSKFPYLLFYEIDEENKIVTIKSCFHTAQNPNKYPL